MRNEPEILALDEQEAPACQIREVLELGGDDHVQRHDERLNRVDSVSAPSYDTIAAGTCDLVFDEPILPSIVTPWVAHSNANHTSTFRVVRDEREHTLRHYLHLRSLTQFLMQFPSMSLLAA